MNVTQYLTQTNRKLISTLTFIQITVNQISTSYVKMALKIPRMQENLTTIVQKVDGQMDKMKPICRSSLWNKILFSRLERQLHISKEKK